VRDAVRALLELAIGPGSAVDSAAGELAVATLHTAARGAAAHVVLDLDADGRACGWTLRHDGSPQDVLTAELASRSILFLGGPDLGQVRRCARPGCSMLFVQRHRSRRFCHPSCAHGQRQARYYRAHRRTAP
jgi:predicted RNA-binding Zn ribbon-like protein